MVHQRTFSDFTENSRKAAVVIRKFEMFANRCSENRRYSRRTSKGFYIIFLAVILITPTKLV